MRRGVSPIVAVVLLIAIAVVAAVGLYFWAGGITTKQPTTSVPIAISATPIDAAGGKVAVANLGSQDLTLSYLRTADGYYCNFTGEVTIAPGQQAVCTMPPKRGSNILYGTGTGQAVMVLPPGEVAEVVFQSNDFTSATFTDTGTGTFTNTTNGSVILSHMGWREVQVNNGPNDQGAGSIGIGANNVLHMSWAGDEDGEGDIYYANNGTGWVAVKVNTDAGEQTNPSMAVTSAGVVHMVWSDTRNGPNYDIYYANSSSGWAETRVTSDPADQIGASIAIDSNGVAHIAWADLRTGGYDIYYANSSSGWAETQVYVGGGDQMEPSLAIGPGNIVHIAWHGFHGGDVDNNIYYANSSAGWAEMVVNNDAGDQFWPSLAVDTGGVAHVAWTDSRSGDYDVYYASSATGWADVPVSGGASDQNWPSLAIGPDNAAHIAWVGSNDGDYDVYYAKSSGGWAETVVKNDTANRDECSLAVGSNGIVYVGWRDDSDGGDYDIYYAKSSHTYSLSGTFISHLIDCLPTGGGEVVRFTSLSWTNSTPAGTTFEFKPYFSNQSDFLVNTTETVDNPDTGIATLARYFRYWLNLTTTDEAQTPVFSGLTMKYRPYTGNLTYSVNADFVDGWVALNKTCAGVNSTVVNATLLDGPFYTNTISVPTDCDYWVYGTGNLYEEVNLKPIRFEMQ